MMEKFKNKYRIPSARAAWWNYGWAGIYFITICTAHREHYFGEIIKNPGNKMQLSHVGVIADVLWYEIPHHAKYIELGSFVVMPNHLHGILILIFNADENGLDGDEFRDVNRNSGDRNVNVGNPNVETRRALSLQLPPPQQQSQPLQPIPPQSTELSFAQQRFRNQGKNTISSIVGSYKSAVTKHAHRLGFEFDWQLRFHDHIIRNDAEYQRINDYIESNPDHWEEDKFFN